MLAEKENKFRNCCWPAHRDLGEPMVEPQTNKVGVCDYARLESEKTTRGGQSVHCCWPAFEPFSPSSHKIGMCDSAVFSPGIEGDVFRASGKIGTSVSQTLAPSCNNKTVVFIAIVQYENKHWMFQLTYMPPSKNSHDSDMRSSLATPSRWKTGKKVRRNQEKGRARLDHSSEHAS